MKAIEIRNLTKKYAEKTVVDNLSLSINEGELVGLLGVNGAGKTTTIKMLCCLTEPTSGDALLKGRSILDASHEVKKIIAVSPQETAIAPNLTVKENLELMAGVHGMSGKEARKKTEEVIESLSLQEVVKQKSKTLSGGWQRRLSIAMALISQPEILFLDEPTLGLDILGRRELWRVIEDLKGKVTIILTTHYLEEAEALCDSICIMQKGKLKAFGTAEELIKLAKTESFEDAFVKLAAEGGAE